MKLLLVMKVVIPMLLMNMAESLVKVHLKMIILLIKSGEHFMPFKANTLDYLENPAGDSRMNFTD